MEKNIFSLSETEPYILSQFIKSLSLSDGKKIGDSNETVEGSEELFEFDEVKFKNWIDQLRPFFEKSKEIDDLREEIVRVREELESKEVKSTRNEARIKVIDQLLRISQRIN